MIDPDMRVDRPAGPRGASRAVTPPVAFALVALACTPPVAASILLLDAPATIVWLIPALFLGGSSLVLRRLRAHYPHPRLGACNAVTLMRMALVMVLLAPALAPETMARHPLAVFGLAAVALALDGADGWLARRAGLASAFGARFDMEVDAALGAMLAVILLRSGPVEGAVAALALLILGFSRYGFVAAFSVLPWLRRPLPDRFSRKVVCVVQIATLMALLLPALGGAFATIAATGAAGLLLWSFGRDVLWLHGRSG